MKRHLRVLTPVYLLYTFIVACGGGSEPPPPVASLPKVTNDIKCADHRLDDALKKCKSGVQDILPLLLAQQGKGGDLNTLLLLQSLNKPKPQQQPFPFPGMPGGNQDACPRPQVDNQTSCKDDLLTALLLWKSAQKSDGQLAINDPQYRRVLELKIKQFLSLAALQWNLNPLQQLYLANQLNQALNSGLLSQGLASGDMSQLNGYLNAALNSPQFKALGNPTPAPQIPGWPVQTPGLNAGNGNTGGIYTPGLNGTYPASGTVSNGQPRSTSLNLSPAGSTRPARSLTTDDTPKGEVVGLNNLRRAFGVGMNSSFESEVPKPAAKPTPAPERKPRTVTGTLGLSTY